ncbi:MAG: DUF819 family protein [Saprospiraceae bacterium]|nr:DUF819 family protein [Saprospiraceae bacterium]
MTQSSSIFIIIVLCIILVCSEWLVHHTILRHLGSALLIILITAIVANLGLIPAGSTLEAPVAVYDITFSYLAPLSIFWLLLQVNLREVLKSGIPTVILFLIGSLGTTFGVVISMSLISGHEHIGPLYAAVGGMFVGTYSGGSANFNAVALHYDVVREGAIYGGSIVVDNIMTTVWMIATLAIPKVMTRVSKTSEKLMKDSNQPILGIEDDKETLHPVDLGIIIALGLFVLYTSEFLVLQLESLGWKIPSIIIVTIFALIIAQLPINQRLRGGQLLGMFSVYLFLAVIGAFCDLKALQELETLGPVLLLFVILAVSIHGVIIYLSAYFMRIDLSVASVASQANVGGATSALALARSLGRSDLVLPAVLLGALGNAVGTFLGFWASGYLLPWISG